MVYFEKMLNLKAQLIYKNAMQGLSLSIPLFVFLDANVAIFVMNYVITSYRNQFLFLLDRYDLSSGVSNVKACGRFKTITSREDLFLVCCADLNC